MFDETFLQYLKGFRFTCDVWAMPEGTPIFPNEPVVTVRGPIIEAQFVETMILLTINHQSLIATKANRIVRAAGGRGVMEFGSRRAKDMMVRYMVPEQHISADALVRHVRLLKESLESLPLGPWHIVGYNCFRMNWRHSELMRGFILTIVLCWDTYSVLKSGVPNAIKIFREEIVPRGFRPKGIRIDSGDITYLSKKARKMLDEAGFEDCQIVASNSLDEFIIRDILVQGAQVDSFGVGERLITSRSEPVFGGVYKLVAVEENGEIVPGSRSVKM